MQDNQGKKETVAAKKGIEKDAKKGFGKITKIVISGPIEFRHLQHVGLSGPSGTVAVSGEVRSDLFYRQ